MQPETRRLTWDLSGNVSEIGCFINSRFITKVGSSPDLGTGGPPGTREPPSGPGVADVGVLLRAGLGDGVGGSPPGTVAPGPASGGLRLGRAETPRQAPPVPSRLVQKPVHVAGISEKVAREPEGAWLRAGSVRGSDALGDRAQRDTLPVGHRQALLRVPRTFLVSGDEFHGRLHRRPAVLRGDPVPQAR